MLAPNNELYTIREESLEPELPEDSRRDVRNSTADSCFFREFDLSDFSDGAGEDCSELDSDFEGWDDETTLVAKFQDKSVLEYFVLTICV